MKLNSFLGSALAFAITFANPGLTSAASCNSGTLIKSSFAAVYYVGANCKRYVFPNDKVYFSWYADFSGVTTVSSAELAAITIGGNVTYRPGSKMVKIQSDPRVYAVSRGGVLRHVGSESLASSIYGAAWRTQVEDIADAFFVNYTVGAEIEKTSDYSRPDESAGAPNINADKRLSQSIQTEATILGDGTITPHTIYIVSGQSVRWTNNDSESHRISTNPHPAHTDLPGFDSVANIAPSASYTYTFTKTGTFNYHDHLYPSNGGTVVVQ